VLLRSRAFLGYALSSAFAQSAWFAFVSGVPYVLHTILGRPITDYGIWILSCAGGYVVGNFLAGRFSVRMGGARMMLIGQAAALAGAALQVGLCVTGVLSPAALFLPMTVIVLAQGLFLPNANAGAISVRPDHAGAASGLLGFLQMTFGAVATLLVGGWLGASEAPLIALTAGTTLASALALLLSRGGR
jgi:DHA1 family bicyclomycin/chloramphenicol resistance-like MFS transporter